MRKTRISGQQMQNFVGEDVILLGNVKKVSSNGTTLELQTADDKIVNIALQEPVDGNVMEGMIECHGTVQSKATMSCTNYIHFPPEMCQNFEPSQYNDLLTILNLLGKQKWKLSETDIGL